MGYSQVFRFDTTLFKKIYKFFYCFQITVHILLWNFKQFLQSFSRIMNCLYLVSWNNKISISCIFIFQNITRKFLFELFNIIS